MHSSIPEKILEYSKQHTPDFDSRFLFGTWQIKASTLSFWQNKTQTTVSYKPLTTNQISDTITYKDKYGKIQTISGIDSFENNAPNIFKWQGNQWYSRFLSSHWIILDYDRQQNNWLFVYFSATLFTKAGFDIYCRREYKDTNQLIDITNQNSLLKTQRLLTIPD